MRSADAYDSAILLRAKHIAVSQGTLADSPARRDDGGALILCGASCIARAAIEINMDDALLHDFDARVVAEDKFDFIPEVFNRFGLSRRVAAQVLAENDARPEAGRLDWFRSLDTRLSDG